MRILLLEDDGDSREAMARILRRHGHKVFVFSHGTEILRHCEGGKPFDLLISDIGLPDEDGWQILPKLRAKCPRFKAIAVTGFSQERDKERCRTAGFDSYLPKPLLFPVLFAEVAKVCADIIRPSLASE